jgi:acetyl-CoA carboxylase carboxyltransferase component
MEIARAMDKEKKRAQFVKEYRDKFANPYVAAGLGYVDKVIFPRETRSLICKGIDMLESKRQTRPPKKHGNIPL